MLINLLETSNIESKMTLIDIHLLSESNSEISFIIDDRLFGKGLYEMIYNIELNKCSTPGIRDYIPNDFKIKVANYFEEYYN